VVSAVLAVFLLWPSSTKWYSHGGCGGCGGRGGRGFFGKFVFLGFFLAFLEFFDFFGKFWFFLENFGFHVFYIGGT
jgi:hypothetical protein